jgi:hypothetical protein
MRLFTITLLLLLSIRIANNYLFITPKRVIDNTERIIKSFAKIESNFDSLAVNIKENAVGYLQIRPIMLAEFNRLTGKNYSLNDRYSKAKSIEIFLTIQKLRNPTFDLRKAANLWNAGHVSHGNLEYFKLIFEFYNNSI